MLRSFQTDTPVSISLFTAKSAPVCLKMATEKDLIKEVRQLLEDDGLLGRMKAEMRTEVMKILNRSDSNRNKNTEIPRNVLIINELVREYLEWIGYKYTSSVLIAESGISKQPLDRSFLLQDLRVSDTETTKKIPLLFSLIEMSKQASEKLG